jgi:hypothetical protein
MLLADDKEAIHDLAEMGRMPDGGFGVVSGRL